MTDEMNFRNLCNLTTEIVGLEEGSLSCKSRQKKYQIPRAVASMVGFLKSGIHFNVISKEIGRDRTLLYHYKHYHKANYQSYPPYRDLFNKVYRAYTCIQDAKPSFEDNDHLRQHLRTFGIYDSNLKQVKLKVISGKTSVKYNFSYEEFSGKLEICKLALKDYDMDTKIL
jgi:hypothetical protein|tara:strand:- start:80 stop:589 length:510 start_codon:yes stop_codon:yes gene_type:complete